MSKSSSVSNDAEYVAELLRLVDDPTRHRLMRELAVQVATITLLAAADAERAPVEIPLSDDGTVDSGELIETFLTYVRPNHEAYDYLDDHWNFIWERAWPEGIADAVLGTSEYDRFAAADLMETIEWQAEDIGLPEGPPFDADDLEAFVADWRGKFVSSLARLVERR